MKSAIFSSGYEAYQVANVIYAGPVSEIPEEKRRNDSTHSFKMITPLGAVRCYYRNYDSAVKARSALGAMMMSMKPYLFRHGYQLIDPHRIVSFRRVVQLRTPQRDYTHAVIVSLETVDSGNNEVWLRYKSEENASKGRRALYAATYALNQTVSPEQSRSDRQENKPQEELVTSGAEKDDLPF